MELQRLPLLEYASANLFRNVSLENVLLVACQHILKPQFQMFLSFFDKGLKPESTFLLGKCYSTDKEALKLFIEKGVNVHKASEYFDSHKSYDEQYEKYVKDFLMNITKRINLSKFDKVILLDDGGFLITLANKYLRNCRNIVGVEQTSSGYEKIKEETLRFPVINVARSQAKLIYETPIIVNQFIKNLNYEINILKRKPRKILIIGAGYIGKGIANKFRNKCEVLTYDVLKEKSDVEDLKSGIKNFDLIIGCSGKSSLPLDFYSTLRRNAVLISASSSDREFFAPHLRLLTKQYYDCHKNVKIRDIVLLNSGFPVTFTSHSIGVDGRFMQITMSLLFSGVCIAISGKNHNNLVDLKLEIQNSIVRKFQELISERRHKQK